MNRQRRSLNRRISQSRRVNSLSDVGALLYTWMIPHYDDDGRMRGQAEDVAMNVMPRKRLSEEDATGILLEMDRLDLIIWYEADGVPYIQMPPDVWEENQSFHSVKRISSKLPPYNPAKHQRYRDILVDTPTMVLDYTRPGVPEHQDGCTTTPNTASKIREDKIRCLSKDKRAGPAPSSPKNRHYTDRLPGQYTETIKNLAKEVLDRQNGKRFPQVFAFVQKMVSQKVHPQAIVETLRELLQRWETVTNPWSYSVNVCVAKSQRFNQKEAIEEHEKLKLDMAAFEKSPEGQEIINLLGGIKVME